MQQLAQLSNGFHETLIVQCAVQISAAPFTLNFHLIAWSKPTLGVQASMRFINYLPDYPRKLFFMLRSLDIILDGSVSPVAFLRMWLVTISVLAPFQLLYEFAMGSHKYVPLLLVANGRFSGGHWRRRHQLGETIDAGRFRFNLDLTSSRRTNGQESSYRFGEGKVTFRIFVSIIHDGAVRKSRKVT